MGRNNDFQEIIGGVFALIIFIMIGGVMVTSLGDPIGFTGLFSVIFGFGALIIGIALIRMIIKLFEGIF
jgi:hypothetical protein